MMERFTDRLKVLRSRELDKSETKLLDDIEKYGWGVMHIRPEHAIPGWSFTVGVYDTVGKPEIIVVGLNDTLAHSVLNDAAKRLQDGADFPEGHREPELLANVDCEFRELDRRWISQAMGWAKWFYGSDQFPVIQCVYPDLKGKFPWETGFEQSWRSRQPLLFAGANETQVEEHFWEANEKGSVYDGWVFSESPHTGVYTTQRINEQKEPITYVSHDEDGDWQFHGPGNSDAESAVLICFHHIVDRDLTIKELADLPLGWCAWRDKVGDPWNREAKETEPNE
jgi:hypothetical protein